MYLRTRLRAFTLLLLLFGAAPRAAAQSSAMDSYVEKIPGTLVSFEMMPVPAGTVQIGPADGRQSVEVGPFWIAKTEVTWDLYDVFVYGLDHPAGSGDADAVARPTKPYVLPGEQFGHEGMPALGMTYHAAQAFARWLSARTGHTYRVPTEAEWEHACRLGKTDPSALDARAWHAGNAGDRTHAAGSSEADALGVHDLLGNVAEWVHGFDGDSVIKGGAFEEPASAARCATRRKQTPAWNATDPQLPKSRWWLPDAPFVGLRLVRDPDT
jgi:formylglycine-generating enzyme required for sulfatase activity